MFERNRSRLRPPYVSRWLMVIGPTGITLLTVVVLAALRVTLDTSLGIAGLVFGLVTAALSAIRERDPPRKTIAFVGQEDVVFNDNILRGIRATTEGALPSDLTVITPPALTGDLVAWQLSELKALEGGSTDALVVLPCGDDQRLWRALAQLRTSGLTVVVVDFPPPDDFGPNPTTQPLLFVASDFLGGGRLAGDLIARRLKADISLVALVSLGPDWSRPGAGRSSQVLYALAREGLIERVRSYELRSWDATAAARDLRSEIADVLSVAGRRVIVFCGDDRIALELSRASHSEPAWTGKVELVGYDGTRAADGRYLAQDYALCVGTIDSQPGLQGRAAGRALLSTYHGEPEGSRTRWLVEPRAVTPPDWL